ncbi:unnamed protein product, partial [marine sediment metagenome]
IAKKMVLDWGMSEKLGPINYSNDDRRIMPLDLRGKEYSDSTAQLIDAEIKVIIDAAQEATRQLIESHRDALQRLAEALLKYETLSAEETGRIVAGETLDKPSVGELLEKERTKAPEPEKAAPPRPEKASGVGPVPEPG